MTTAVNQLRASSQNGLLSSKILEETRLNFGLSHAEIEMLCLEATLLPARYQRNRTTITVDQQLKLFSSKVAVVGCGGLGGYIIEELARLGIGKIVVIDPDIFEDHNLNRQLLSTMSLIGQSKAEAAAQRIAEINPAVTVTPVQIPFCKDNGADLLADINVVADAVDSIKTRFDIVEICRQLNIPLVHAAIGGWYGHVCTVFPGEKTLEKIYRDQSDDSGVEQELGNPAFTPAVIAGFEVAEICKIILGKDNLLRNRKLTIDLLDMEIEAFAL